MVKASERIVIVLYVALPTLFGMGGFVFQCMALDRGPIAGQVFVITTAAVTIGVFAITAMRAMSTMVSRRAHLSPPRQAKLFVYVMSSVCLLKGVISFESLRRMGVASLYVSSMVLDEARDAVLSETAAQIFPGAGQIATLASMAVIALPFYLVLWWGVLPGICRIVAICCSLLWPLYGIATLGRLNAAIIAYVVGFALLANAIGTRCFWRRVRVGAAVLALATLCLFGAGAVREYSGEGQRGDRASLVDSKLVSFSPPIVSAIEPVSNTLIGRAILQMLNYAWHPWYYCAQLVFSENRPTQPFTANFYFISWPAVALRLYPTLPERQAAVARSRAADGVAPQVWATTLYSMSSDFGVPLGATFCVALGWLGGISLRWIYGHAGAALIAVALILGVVMLPMFSAFSIYAVEFSVYAGFCLIAVRHAASGIVARSQPSVRIRRKRSI